MDLGRGGRDPRRQPPTLRFTGILNDRLHGFYRSTYKDAGGATRTLAR